MGGGAFYGIDDQLGSQAAGDSRGGFAVFAHRFEEGVLVFGVGVYPADGDPGRGGLGAGVVLGGFQAMSSPLAAEVSRRFDFVEVVEEAGIHEIELQGAFFAVDRYSWRTGRLPGLPLTHRPFGLGTRLRRPRLPRRSAEPSAGGKRQLRPAGGSRYEYGGKQVGAEVFELADGGGAGRRSS